MNMTNRIFRAGTHISSSGEEVTITEADLNETVNQYKAERHEAPVVIGHPSDNAPAYGWVSNLSVRNGELYADIGQVEQHFADAVRSGRYKKISASFYHPQSPVNPKPGVWYLRHVGVLGAVPPAVKGLGNAMFTEGDFVAFSSEELEFGMGDNETVETVAEQPVTTETAQIDYAEISNELSRKVAELESRVASFGEQEAAMQKREQAIRDAEAQLVRQGIAMQLQKRVDSGVIQQSVVGGLQMFLESITTLGTVDFGEKKQTPVEFFLQFLDSQPRHDAGVVFGEVAKDAETPKRSVHQFAEDISKYVAEHDVPYHVAATRLGA
jgi:hypothetical protein